MARPKLPRKSTSIDMTAMCDVAFLLLSFFILTTKFKESEPITVNTPNSVASKIAPSKDYVLITIDKEGKIFLSMDDEQKKAYIANVLNNTKGMHIDVNAFKKAEFFGVSFNQLASFVQLPKESRVAANLPGIPCKDSANNEMAEWMRLVNDAYQGGKMNLLLKGDNMAKYPAFESVIEAFKKNDNLKFQMITNPVNVPIGTDLWQENQKPTAATNDKQES